LGFTAKKEKRSWKKKIKRFFKKYLLQFLVLLIFPKQVNFGLS